MFSCIFGPPRVPAGAAVEANTVTVPRVGREHFPLTFALLTTPHPLRLEGVPENAGEEKADAQPAPLAPMSADEILLALNDSYNMLSKAYNADMAIGAFPPQAVAASVGGSLASLGNLLDGVIDTRSLPHDKTPAWAAERHLKIRTKIANAGLYVEKCKNAMSIMRAAGPPSPAVKSLMNTYQEMLDRVIAFPIDHCSVINEDEANALFAAAVASYRSGRAPMDEQIPAQLSHPESALDPATAVVVLKHPGVLPQLAFEVLSYLQQE